MATSDHQCSRDRTASANPVCHRCTGHSPGWHSVQSQKIEGFLKVELLPSELRKTKSFEQPSAVHAKVAPSALRYIVSSIGLSGQLPTGCIEGVESINRYYFRGLD